MMWTIKPYSEDLRLRIVRGRPRWHVHIHSRSPLRREPLLRQALPQDRPEGSVAGAEEGGWKTAEDRPDCGELLEEDIAERPTATVYERRRFLEHTTGKALSD